MARLKDEPFALIGVNSDSDLEKLQPILKEQQITWRSFWNGKEGTGGPISKRWGITGWPSLYLIDAQGKIRHKFTTNGSPGDEELDRLIDELVAEAKKAPKKSCADSGWIAMALAWHGHGGRLRFFTNLDGAKAR